MQPGSKALIAVAKTPPRRGQERRPPSAAGAPVPQLDRAFGVISQRSASLPAQGLTQRRGRPTQNQEAGQGRRQLHPHLAGKMLPRAGRPGPPAAPGAPLPAARHPYCSGPLLGVFDRFPGCLCRSGQTVNQRERQGRRASLGCQVAVVVDVNGAACRAAQASIQPCWTSWDSRARRPTLPTQPCNSALSPRAPAGTQRPTKHNKTTRQVIQA